MKKVLLFIFGLMLFNTILYAQEKTIINEVTVYLPQPPQVGVAVNYDYEIPINANYTKVTWNNGKMFVNGFTFEDKYFEGEDYEWMAVVCPKDGYAFPSDLEDLNIIADGFNVDDNTIVKSKSVSQNGDICRGLDLHFQTLPGTTYKFLSTPKHTTAVTLNEEADLSFKFSTDAEIKLQKSNGSEWEDVKTINAIGNEVTNFNILAESTPSNNFYRLNYDDKKFAEFRVIWLDPEKILYDVDVTLPKRPLAGKNINFEYSIPNGVHYTKADWLGNKMLINSEGIAVEGKYEENKNYTWLAIVCPKDGYTFTDNLFALNFNVSGIDLNADYIYSYYITENATTCRGIQITFKPIEYIPLLKPNLGISANNTTIELTWEKQLYAESYYLYRSLDNKTWKRMTISTGTSYTDKGLTYNQRYYYKMRVYDGEEFSPYSEVASRKIAPHTTTLSVTSAGTNNVKLAWDKVNNTGYSLYRSTDNSTWSLLKNITTNKTLTYNDSSLKENKLYFYKIRAYQTVNGSKVYGSYSNVIKTRTAPVVPTLALRSTNYDTIRLTIGEAKGTSQYRIYRSLDNKTWERIGILDNYGKYYDKGHEVGITYYYKVRACNVYNNCSAYVSSSMKQTVETPSLTVSSTTSKKVSITVGSVEEAAGYRVYRSTSKNDSYTMIADIKDPSKLSFNDSTKSGTTYYYKVRAYSYVDGSKLYSQTSGAKSVKSK